MTNRTRFLAAAAGTALTGTLSAGAPQGKIEPMTADQLAHETVRVAAVQIDSPWVWTAPIDPANDPADRIVPYIERAAVEGADLVVFPELYLGMFRVPSEQTEKVSAAAREHEINVIVGCFEVIDDEGNYGNSTLIFDREGDVVGRYFKAAPAVGATSRGWPPVADDPEWMMTPGTEFPVFDLDFGRIGIMTCYDGYFPEIPRILSLKGAEIIVWPNARGGSIEDHIVRTTLQHNYVHMINTNKSIGAGTSIAEWPHGIAKEVTEPVEGFLIDDLDMARLRTGRIYGREFAQRAPATYHELTMEWPVWEQYGTSPGDVVPEPDVERRREILQNIGVGSSEIPTGE